MVPTICPVLVQIKDFQYRHKNQAKHPANMSAVARKIPLNIKS